MENKHEMPKEIADHIRLLVTGRVGHSFRKLSEVICDIYPDFIKERQSQSLRGNQMHGQWLCEEAAKVLGVSREEYEKSWIG